MCDGAPPPIRAGTMVRLGASRMSSVLGLKVTPSTATVRPLKEPPQASRSFSTIRAFTSLFTCITVSVIRIGKAWSWPIRASAAVSLGKQEPP